MKLFSHHRDQDDPEERKPLEREGGDHQIFITRIHNTLNKEIVNLLSSSEREEISDEQEEKVTLNEKVELDKSQTEEAPRMTGEQIENTELNQNEVGLVVDSIEMSDFSTLVNLLWTNAKAPVSFRNHVELVHGAGRDISRRVFDCIESATHHIHIQYEMLEGSTLSPQIVDLLARKSESGIAVRLLYSGTGGIDRKIRKKWGNYNVNFHPFSGHTEKSGINFFKRHTSNGSTRNLVIVDGENGFLGEINLSNNSFSTDKEAFLMVRGDSVNMMQGIFCDDWEFCTGQNMRDVQVYPSAFYPETHHSETDRLVPMQVFSAEPSSPFTFSANFFPSLVHSARKCVYIISPSFDPSNDILDAIEHCCRGGKDVRIVVQGEYDYAGSNREHIHISDKALEKMEEFGAKIHRFEGGALRCRMMVVDHRVSVIGTLNFDKKLFETNHEMNAVIYDNQISKHLEDEFWEDAAAARGSQEHPPVEGERSTERRGSIEKREKRRGLISRLFGKKKREQA